MWRNSVTPDGAANRRRERSDGSFCFGSSVPPGVTVHSTITILVKKKKKVASSTRKWQKKDVSSFHPVVTKIQSDKNAVPIFIMFYTGASVWVLLFHLGLC